MSTLIRDHDLSCDILIAGGGPAGVPAAIAAARGGASAILCHDRPMLGGNASSEVRMHIVGADQHGARGRKADPMTCETREGGIIEEIRLETSIRNAQRSAHMLDLILYDKVKAEPNIMLLLNTSVVAAEVTGSAITHAIAHRISTEDRFRIAAKVFIDCTGDGRLGAEAGARFRHGREARSEFGEQYALDVADAKTLGSSLLFTARDMGKPAPFIAPAWARKFTDADFVHRRIRGYDYGYWWVEWGGQLDTIKENARIQEELTAIVMGIWDYVKNSGQHPEAANYALDFFGWLPGKRESRRFIGQYILRESDLLESRRQPDAIAYGGWKIDLHPPEGIDLPDEKPYTPMDVPWLYDIPLRCCVSADLSNLMFAGRNISATHVAFASTRVMATCATIGQGVGTAAAYAVRHDLQPAGLAADPHAIAQIQQRLMRDDCYLIGQLNEDAADLARHAIITASSHQRGGEPGNIVSGQTRSVHAPNAAPPDRARPGVHRWIAQRNPAWIELRWPEPVNIALVQITFDSNLQEELTLTQAREHVPPNYGRPQTGLVSDYALEAESHGVWRPVVSISDNHLRLRRHRIEQGTDASALRVRVNQTHGAEARIVEIRVYDKVDEHAAF